MGRAGRKSACGYTLVEVLIGSALGAGLVLAATAALKAVGKAGARGTARVEGNAELAEVVQTVERIFRNAYLPLPGAGAPYALAPELVLPIAPKLNPPPLSVFFGAPNLNPALGPCNDLMVRRHKSVSVKGTTYTGVETIYFTNECGSVSSIPVSGDLFPGETGSRCTGKQTWLAIRSYLSFDGPDNPVGNPAPPGSAGLASYHLSIYPRQSSPNKQLAVCFRKDLSAPSGTSAILVETRARAFNGESWASGGFTPNARKTALILSANRAEIMPVLTSE